MIDLVNHICPSFILLDLRNIIKQIVADIHLVIDSVWTSWEICHALYKFIDFIDFLVIVELLKRLILCSLK